jgi:Putative regulator of cell autolysis
MIDKINHIIPDFLTKPKFRFFRHLLVQTVVIFITVNIMWDEPDKILSERLGAWFAYFLQINTIIYINKYLLVPRLLIKGRALFYLLSLPLITISAAFVISLFQENPADNNATNPSVLGSISSLAAFGLFIIGLTTIQLFKYRLGNIQKISELENATTAIELANLQNQINPHFLFNMLNNANILAGEDSEKSSYLLSKLNDLLRYQTNVNTKRAVKLTDDIAFLNDYLNLEKMRRDRFSYKIHTEGNTDIDVPPLLFIPFIENAVKHNPENDSYVDVIFRVTDNRLYFECKNPKAKLFHTKKEGGIGLVNIKRRLDLLFGDNYSLNLKDEKEEYLINYEMYYCRR